MSDLEKEIKDVIKTIPLPFIKTFIDVYKKIKNDYLMENFGKEFEVISWVSCCHGGTSSFWWNAFEEVCKRSNCELEFLDFFKKLNGDEKELFQICFAEYIEELNL
ncbi:MAG: hypothetical protein FWD32_02270 [Firmicutes bacterium]|nr:hypothetical protein [Bacillota bacterium]